MYKLTSLLLIFSCHLALANAENKPIQVTAKPLQAVLIERQLSANANVKALNQTKLSSEVSAVVTDILADSGDAVEKGQDLIILDDTDLQLQVAQAKANLAAVKARREQAELRLKRAQELKQSEYISEDDLLVRHTELAVQKAEEQKLAVAVKIAVRQAQKTKIKAPFSGVLTTRTAQKGQLLAVGTEVLSMTQLDGREIHAMIPNQLASTLSQANTLTFVNNNINTPVELIRLSPVINAQTSVQIARFKIMGEAPAVGDTGQLRWTLQDNLLSADMVIKRDGRLGVFIVNGTTAKFMELPGAQEGRPVVIDQNNNWQVIVGGRDRLQDGDRISVK